MLCRRLCCCHSQRGLLCGASQTFFKVSPDLATQQSEKEKKLTIDKQQAALLSKRADTNQPSLEEQLKETWKNATKVIHKDLPRLAKRMTIHNSQGVIVENGRLLANPLSTSHQLSPVSASTQSSTSSSNVSSSLFTAFSNSLTAIDPNTTNNTSNNTTTTTATTSATTSTQPKVDTPILESATTSNTSSSSANSANSGGDPSTVDILQESSSKTINSRDRTSTSNQISSTFNTLRLTPLNLQSASLSPESENGGSYSETWSSVTNVLMAVVRHFESKEDQEKLKAGLDCLGKTIDEHVDFEVLVEKLFKNYIDYQSKTAKVFKICHQAALFPAVYYLQTRLFAAIGHMKDVRRQDGWNIRIYLGDAIYVTHTRWEQNLAAADSPEHFEVLWELRCSFDKEMTDLFAVFVRVNDIKFHDQVTPQFKEQVTQVIRGSGYII